MQKEKAIVRQQETEERYIEAEMKREQKLDNRAKK